MEPTEPEGRGPAHLLVFARLPEWGKVKTRLAATEGPAVALRVYERLLDLTEQAVAAAGTPATLWLAEASEGQRTVPAGGPGRWRGLPWRVQNPALDLGGRLAEAFAEAFAAGAGRVAVVGTDCPDLTAGILLEALARLATHDVVLGPAADGGYYLLALRRPCPELFQNIAWSSPAVLAQTRAAAAALGLRVRLLAVLHDVDTAADLAHWPGWQG